VTTLYLPGLGNSGAGHWQTLWEEDDPDGRRVVQDEWDEPDPVAWRARLEEAVRAAEPPVVLVAHSLGCALTAHWARDGSTEKVAAALLVSPPDVDAAELTVPEIYPFAPMPLERLPFPAIVVASSDDPYVRIARAREFARAWGADLVEVGAAGHINADSGHGEWPEGQILLERLRRAADGEGPMVTLSHAAEAVGVSTSTLRRWADDGRIRFVRTGGGHRRFPASDVRRLAASRAGWGASEVRPLAPPSRPLPGLARLVAARGLELAGESAKALYSRDGEGWFRSADAQPHLHRWVRSVALACLSGSGRQAVDASLAMLRRAELVGATLLERHVFVENMGAACVRVLDDEPETHGEASAAGRLFRSIGQSLLDD
jgi:excisionase family DNA binding protein